MHAVVNINRNGVVSLSGFPTLSNYEMLVDSNYRSLEYQGVGFSINDPEVKKRVEDFHEFIDELVVE